MKRTLLTFVFLLVFPAIAHAAAAGNTTSGPTSPRATTTLSRTTTSSRPTTSSRTTTAQRPATTRENASRVVSGRGAPTNSRNVAATRTPQIQARTTGTAITGVGAKRAAVTSRATSTPRATTSRTTSGGRTTTRAVTSLSRAASAIMSRTPTIRVSSTGLSAAQEPLAISMDDFDNMAQLTDFCKAQYMNCMDNYCNVLDEEQGRCSCSANLKNYAATEAALKQATEELQDIAQKIQYIGLTADQVTTLLTQTEAEAAMQSTTDNTQLKNDLDKIREMIIKPKAANNVGDTTGGISLDLSGLLDFSFDANNISLSSMFGGTSGNQSINNQRGEQLYKTAATRCKAVVLNSCSANGVDTNLVTNAYDLEIDRSCGAYERNLTEQNDQMKSTIRNATSVLQRARLVVSQQKNQYDLRGCVTAIDNCMQDEFVCGDDYENCLDPTGKYIVNGELVVGSLPGVAANSAATGLYATWAYGKKYAWATTDRDGSLSEYIEDKIWSGSSANTTRSTTDMATFLQQKIGYIDKNGKPHGMCAAYLNMCQDMTYSGKAKAKTYQYDNDVIRNYLQTTLAKIKATQDTLLAEYGEQCISDVLACVTSNSSTSYYGGGYGNINTDGITDVSLRACRMQIATCRSVLGDLDGISSDDRDWLERVLGTKVTDTGSGDEKPGDDNTNPPAEDPDDPTEDPDDTECKGLCLTPETGDLQYEFDMCGMVVGEFRVDWGDGSEPTDATCAGDTQRLSHEYPAAANRYEIEITGTATSYSTATRAVVALYGTRTASYAANIKPAISFAATGSHVKAVRGGLGRIFPSRGSTQPNFYQTFMGNTALTTIPSGLFNGITGSTPYMFDSTFKASGLTTIPDGLFANINQAAAGLFNETFSNCSNLRSIPTNTFGRIDGDYADNMFNATFANCPSLTGDAATVVGENGKRESLWERWPDVEKQDTFVGSGKLNDFNTIPPDYGGPASGGDTATSCDAAKGQIYDSAQKKCVCDTANGYLNYQTADGSCRSACDGGTWVGNKCDCGTKYYFPELGQCWVEDPSALISGCTASGGQLHLWPYVEDYTNPDMANVCVCQDGYSWYPPYARCLPVADICIATGGTPQTDGCDCTAAVPRSGVTSQFPDTPNGCKVSRDGIYRGACMSQISNTSGHYGYDGFCVSTSDTGKSEKQIACEAASDATWTGTDCQCHEERVLWIPVWGCGGFYEWDYSGMEHYSDCTATGGQPLLNMASGAYRKARYAQYDYCCHPDNLEVFQANRCNCVDGAIFTDGGYERGQDAYGDFAECDDVARTCKPVTNRCVCDTASGYERVGNRCLCVRRNEGYVSNNGRCVPPVAAKCTSTQVWDPTANNGAGACVEGEYCPRAHLDRGNALEGYFAAQKTCPGQSEDKYKCCIHTVCKEGYHLYENSCRQFASCELPNTEVAHREWDDAKNDWGECRPIYCNNGYVLNADGTACVPARQVSCEDSGGKWIYDACDCGNGYYNKLPMEGTWYDITPYNCWATDPAVHKAGCEANGGTWANLMGDSTPRTQPICKNCPTGTAFYWVDSTCISKADLCTKTGGRYTGSRCDCTNAKPQSNAKYADQMLTSCKSIEDACVATDNRRLFTGEIGHFGYCVSAEAEKSEEQIKCEAAPNATWTGTGCQCNDKTEHWSSIYGCDGWYDWDFSEATHYYDCQASGGRKYYNSMVGENFRAAKLNQYIHCCHRENLENAPESCACVDGAIFKDDRIYHCDDDTRTCKPSMNRCVCDTGYERVGNECLCVRRNEGYVSNNGRCVPPAGAKCTSTQVWDQTANNGVGACVEGTYCSRSHLDQGNALNGYRPADFQRPNISSSDDYKTCTHTECKEGYHLYNNFCRQFASCELPNTEIARREWDNAKNDWGECRPIECDRGYVLNADSTACIPALQVECEDSGGQWIHSTCDCGDGYYNQLIMEAAWYNTAPYNCWATDPAVHKAGCEAKGGTWAHLPTDSTRTQPTCKNCPTGTAFYWVDSTCIPKADLCTKTGGRYSGSICYCTDAKPQSNDKYADQMLTSCKAIEDACVATDNRRLFTGEIGHFGYCVSAE